MEILFCRPRKSGDGGYLGSDKILPKEVLCDFFDWAASEHLEQYAREERELRAHGWWRFQRFTGVLVEEESQD